MLSVGVLRAWALQRSQCGTGRLSMTRFGRLTGVIVLAAMLFPVAARASVFAFSFSLATTGSEAGKVYGSGQFITDDTISPFHVTDVTGSVTNLYLSPTPVAITGISTYYGADNLLSYPGPYVSYNGISFLTEGGRPYNLWYFFNRYTYETSPVPYDVGESVDYGNYINLSVSPAIAVPSPIAGAGLPALLALGGLAWWRRRYSASALAA
jgi:MYXO-CTERM domain-containing protein